METNQSIVSKIGWLASVMGICMFFSFVDQIRLNLGGHPGSIVLPVATVMNCAAWTAFGFLKPKRDWPLILSNGLGVCGCHYGAGSRGSPCKVMSDGDGHRFS